MDQQSDDTDALKDDEENIPEKEPSVEKEEEIDPRFLLTKEQIDYYKTIFDEFDTNKKERVSTKTIGFALRMVGLNPTKAEIKQHIQEIDPQNKGLIDFQTFLLPIAQRVNQEPETHEDIIAAFKILDEEENGYISTDLLTEYLTSLGEDLEDFEIELLIKMSETKGTKKVYYVEFVEKMMGIVRKSPKDGKKGKGKKK